MQSAGPRQIVVAGGGIAGLTAAIAFARRGFAVQVHERAASFEEAGSGLQLSPNAVHVLRELGVLDALSPVATKPDAVILRDARTLAVLARVELGAFAERRWGAPYLVAHRADLQSVLLSRAGREPGITIFNGSTVADFAVHDRGITVSTDRAGKVAEVAAGLLVGADGVWSTLRSLAGGKGRTRFSGYVAWRATIRSESAAGTIIGRITDRNTVTVFVDPKAHLVVYPLRGGEAVNLVAVVRGASPGDGWGGRADPSPLLDASAACAPAFRDLIEAAGSWTAWPIQQAEPDNPWTVGNAVALIGDAAHAMTPFAAQGAAMAIEDAATLADAVLRGAITDPARLSAWEASRRTRVARVVRRGAFNRFAWHASGPVAAARNLILRLRPPEKLAADLDWLYGWRPPGKP